MPPGLVAGAEVDLDDLVAIVTEPLPELMEKRGAGPLKEQEGSPRRKHHVDPCLCRTLWRLCDDAGIGCRRHRGWEYAFRMHSGEEPRALVASTRRSEAYCRRRAGGAARLRKMQARLDCSAA